jgi:hypothetical protein
MTKKRNLIIFLMILSINVIPSGMIYAQDMMAADPGISSNYYRTLSLGINNPMYRDFATSPLFYNGYGIYLQTSWLKRSTKRERSLEVGIGGNSVSARIPESNFFQPSTSGFYGQLNARYLQLWELKQVSNEKNNIKLGGVIQTSQNIRVNTNLFNNAIGLEKFINIMASGQIIRDVSRKTQRQLNLWLFKPTLKPVKKELLFQFNAGLLNLNFRPGYAFYYFEEIVGLETQLSSWLLSNYKWTLNGWRFNTEFEYIKYLPNGNAKSWSYVWDAANAPGRFETFQMASHQIRYTYYFHTKTR